MIIIIQVQSRIQIAIITMVAFRLSFFCGYTKIVEINGGIDFKINVSIFYIRMQINRKVLSELSDLYTVMLRQMKVP